MSERDLAIINAMHRYGGGFVKALACACEKADDDNLSRLKVAFPELWERFSGMADKS